ncbi:WD repeat-containing protein 90 [Poecilia reticulata]|uniref:WD repeat-containing protein 90 n=1 Tax=Poecilia reticulata TaxID=8081 RepID=UPI0007E94A78|nr:PREDICTED: WD repeat-containing protein 90 [Poecilia reticulata]
MASTGWQHPYVNIFKHVKVEQWKRSAKAGDVASSMDRTLRCPVFSIKGPVPTNSYILVPKSSHQSLGLTGRYFYLLFRPTPGKYFMVHLDVAVKEGQVVRISFSNMFKEFKSTNTWLQFPFLCGAAKDSVYDKTSRSARRGLVGPAPDSVRWTCLMIDLCFTLTFYLNRRHAHLKSVKLCANMAVKNMFTSDLLLEPAVTFSEAKLRGLSSCRGTGPIPREMSFPVPKGGSWNDFYDHVKFPSDGTKLPFDSIQKPDPEAGSPSDQTDESRSTRIGGPVQHRGSPRQPIAASKLLPGNRASVASSVPELSPSDATEAGVHVYAHPQDALSTHGDSSGDEVFSSSASLPVASFKESQQRQQLLPDPILQLSRIIGFGGATTRYALWTNSGEEVVYPCHAIIVSMKILSREQQFFIGHTDKISALTFNGSTTLLASAQSGSNSVVRLWDYSGGSCLSMFRAHSHSLSCLSFSSGGGILCGVGKDRHNKTMVVVWNTLNAAKGGEGTILATVHTDVDIVTMKVTSFDETRMVSCGRENVRLWRVRNGSLRSCPVYLGEFHSLDFTDVAFQEGGAAEQQLDDRTLFASTRSGHVLEIDYSRVTVKNVRRLMPAQQQHAERREKWTFSTGPGIPINSISVSSSFCATGTEDGFLRLWTLDFSAVILEAGRHSGGWERFCPHERTDPHGSNSAGRLSVSGANPCLLVVNISSALGFELVTSGLVHLSVCDDDPAKPVQPTSPSESPDERRPVVSFLKVTDLDGASPEETDQLETMELSQNKPDRPNCYKHFIPRLKTSSLDQSVSAPRPRDEGIKLKAVIGYNGNGRGNMGWSPDQGLFAYSCGAVVVLEHLHTGTQSHLQGHSEEISCLAISNDAQTLASAAGSSRSLVSIWDVQTAACRGAASHHQGAVQSLAFSRDDLFFLSVGDFWDPVLALWSSESVQLLCSVSMSAPIHDAAFSPTAARQLACVGSEGIHFCLIHTHASNADVRVSRCSVAPPPEVGDVELTALCYHMDSFLLTSTSGGHVCAWDVNKQRCFMVWRADEGEIGVLLCRENRLLTGGATGRLQLWQIEAVQGMKSAETTCSVKDMKLRGSKVVVEQEVVLDGTLVSAAFDSFMDMGIVGTTAGTLWYINWSDSSIIRLVSGHRAKVNDVVFSCDESRFATCSQDGSVRVWSTGSFELVVQFQVINQACGCLCWSPSSSSDGSRIAAGYGDGTLRIFQLASTQMEMKLRPHQDAVTAITYSASGHVILSAGSKGLVAVSSPISGATIRVIRDHKGAAINSIQSVSEQCKRFGLEGNEMFLVSGADRRVSVWAANWSKEKCDLLDWLSFPAPPSSEVRLLEDSLPPSLAAFYPADPRLLLYTGFGLEKELSFYSLTKKQIIKKISLTHWATCISPSPKGHLLAVGSKERVLKLIKTTSGRFQDFLQHSDGLQTCRFSPSGSLLFSVAYDEVLLWDVPGL